MKKVQLTKDGYDALEKEHLELVNLKKQKAIDRLQKARAMGDLSENSEYSAAKEDLAFIEGRIRELETLLKQAEIVNQKQANGKINIGCKVTVLKDGTKEIYTIVGEFEANPMEKKLSATSPIGKALLGKKIGETVKVDVPVGKLTYQIIDIKNG
ncbi:transcription elongation factor GreA [Candidatus Roizmanbacteria bacterium RIFCSPLOWO2_01_FULL_41_22]|uniref:Transcription elongation factor GreA n=2 Tax=Candidatus Roizmaniibacteriota TaxID=1752723 RepID=A0A1F7JQV8_9BACT|nr:MAG: transcription elongation factor GreA [Candidatus Roizmanbacteria bacterium RIFCSPLOWO2_01_FULL_41_22]OGK58000.1 MAG: transcription elongation factor GreA [Candidatus Roizmanbacteria bacterium RIFCSPLOWO2_02_FULL_41_9]